MGKNYSALCLKCGNQFHINEGGGFLFHLLHCDVCGREKLVTIKEIEDIHFRYVKGLGKPYCSLTSASNKHIQDTYIGEAITAREYYSAIETIAGKCYCGGQYSMTAKPRCPNCYSSEIKRNEEEVIYYD